MRALLWLLVLAGSAWGADPGNILDKLGDEDFEVREAASAKLATYPAEWVKTFMLLAVQQDDPEVAYRLKLAAKQVYINTVITKSKEWRTLHGCFPFGGDHTNVFQVEERGADQNPSRVTTYITSGYLVLWVDDSVKPWIHSRDFIMECSDGVYWSDIKVAAGDTYTLSLRRYKDPESVAKDCTYVDDANKDFETVEVKVTAVWKDPRLVPWMEEDKIISSQWAAFRNRLEEEEQTTPDAAARH